MSGATSPSNPTTIAPGPTYSPNALLNGPLGESYNSSAAWLPVSLAFSFLFPIEYGFGGNGQTIAVVGDAAASQSDLNTFGAAAGLPTIPAIHGYTLDGGDPSPDSEAKLEAGLDVQTVSGLAPYATIDDVVIPNLTSMEILGALQLTVQDLNPNVVSISIGACESDSISSDMLYDSIAQEAAATGVTIVASAGDEGPTCYDGSGQIAGVSEPASDPYVVAAGGNEDSMLHAPYPTTIAQLDALLQVAEPWNDSQGSGGGGVSAVWQIPAYQNAPGIISTASSSTNRNVPDISLPSSGAGPAAIVLNGTWSFVYGTSWAAPQFAAMQAEINQQCGSSRWGLPDLYRVYYQAPSAFIDVTTGNISWSTTSLRYAAGVGYDNASGLGLPLGEAIAVEDGC